MLNLSRYAGEEVELTDENGLMIKIKVIEVNDDGRVLIGFGAPKYIKIVRTEIKRQTVDGNT